MNPNTLVRLPQSRSADTTEPPPATTAESMPIGQRLRALRPLTDSQVEQILLHQRKTGARFGDAALALDLVSREDVARALSEQYDFPYASADNSRLGAELVTAVAPFSNQAEVFRDLRTRLLMEALDTQQPPAALAVLSTDTGDGKTYCAANLAVSLSQMGRRTLLVDADMRTPRQHSVFGLKDRGGLSDVLAGRRSFGELVHTIDELPSLEVLLSGGVPPNPQELLQRPTFTLLIQELVGRFDHVIVDTPAAALGADARLLAVKCGAALVVGRRHRTPVRALQTLLANLDRSGTRTAGVLLNQR